MNLQVITNIMTNLAIAINMIGKDSQEYSIMEHYLLVN